MSGRGTGFVDLSLEQKLPQNNIVKYTSDVDFAGPNRHRRKMAMMNSNNTASGCLISLGSLKIE